MPTAEGTVEDIVFRNEDNGYTVLNVVPEKGKTFTAVGVIPFADVGDFIRLEGDWTEHRDYGTQFKADKFELVLPETKSAIENYLGSGVIRGCGAETAKRLVKHFGGDTLHILDTDPMRITEVSGIGHKKAQMIIESYREKRDAQQAMMFLFEAGLSSNMAMRVYTKFGSDTIAIVKSDPYRLADDVKGIGFNLADGIARKLGYSLTDERRLMSGIKYVLEEAVSSAGHTYLPEDILLSDSSELLGVDAEMCEQAMLRQVFAGRLVCEDSEEPGRRNVYIKALYDTEADVAVRLMRLVFCGKDESFDPEKAIEKFEREGGVELSALQKDAVRLASESRVTVITGGPGTGKTTLIKCLISVFSSGKIALCAPTGRAAKRMSEATGRKAATIHRMLEYGGDEDTFQKDEDEPLDADTVIVDEMSMVDIFLMRALLKALKPGTRLVLTGDADQLPSVGAGNVLGDIISSGAVPVVRLTEVFRQSGESAIVMNAHRINRGEMPVVNAKGSDFFLERKPTPEAAAASVCELVRKRLPQFMGFDPVKDIQVMAPMKKGEAGVFALNAQLQDILNPAQGKQLKRGDTSFRVHDKVMQMKNDYNIEWKRGDEEGQGVFNGDIGYVKALDTEEKVMTVAFDDGRVADYTEDMLDEMELAYCMSVHKSQGSEFPCVVMPLVNGPQLLMTRNLLYTAVTRARKLVVITGREDCVRRMVANDRVQDRYTSLTLRLKHLCPAE